MKDKNLQQAKIAQVMLETGNAKPLDTSREIQTLRITIDKLNQDIKHIELQLATVDSKRGPSAKNHVKNDPVNCFATSDAS